MDVKEMIEGLESMSRADLEALSADELRKLETLLHHWDEMALIVLDATKKKLIRVKA